MRVDSDRHRQPQAGVGAAFAGAARTSSFDFTLTTADGDRVTLSTLTLIGGVLAFGPAPAETAEASDEPEPIEAPQPLEQPQPVAA